MTDYDIKAISILLGHIEKTILVETAKVIEAVKKRNIRPKIEPNSVKLQRAKNQLVKLRRENEELHRLLANETNKVQPK